MSRSPRKDLPVGCLLGIFEEPGALQRPGGSLEEGWRPMLRSGKPTPRRVEGHCGTACAATPSYYGGSRMVPAGWE
ncbi:hypothetical protein I79_007537 [Cricetulus griseus]|uniref:Uncharacterized protein n=1 Tax=Cricetulus griseus TaxID=10029 RepID=G3HAT0_CRIGR|nr:hypothetical protein I79_007537 [Cricetulus griseus]